MTKGHGELCCRWHSTKEAAAKAQRERERERTEVAGERAGQVKECCQPLIDPFQRESTLIAATHLRLPGRQAAPHLPQSLSQLLI